MTQSHSDAAGRGRVGLRLEIEERPGRWLLEEESVPETPLHDAIIELLMLILKQWAAREDRSALITSNLGCRWDPSDARVGIDPDVVLLEPAPPEGEALTTLRVWEPGHVAPRIAVEVVSASTADKDYLDGAARCARLGARELWVFDPLLEGPSSTGGPFVLQIWRLDEAGQAMTRVHAGAAPAYSEELGAWVTTAEEGRRLRIADDENGTKLWLTHGEAEAKRANAEAERAEAAEAEVARLRALLDRDR